MVASGTAAAWPASAEWASLLSSGLPIDDPSDDSRCGTPQSDIVSAPDQGSMGWWADETDVYFQLLVDGSPELDGEPPVSNRFSILLRTEEDAEQRVFGISVLDNGLTLSIIEYATEPDWTAPHEVIHHHDYALPLDNGQLRARSSGREQDGASGDEDHWLQLRVKRFHLQRAGISAPTALQIASGSGKFGHPPYTLGCDWAGRDDALQPTQDIGWSDPVYIDRDQDGATDVIEVASGTDPSDPDSDGDGVSDGLELDCGGASPDDRDDDGVPDTDEIVLGDSDLDGAPNWCDDDDDGDGIPTNEEGAGDLDGDGTPNHLDDDSDGDGLGDEVEGSEDLDCDTVADFLDAENEDGPCGDLDQDGASNQAEAECGSDPEAPDSDGDGIVDGEESCDDDSDGDGVPDSLDPYDDPDVPPEWPSTGSGPYGFDGGSVTGGGCASAPALPSLSLLFASFAVLLGVGRRVARVPPSLMLALLLLLTSRASPAQSLNADRLRVAGGDSPMLVVRDAGTGAEGPRIAGLASWTDDPLIYRFPDARDEVGLLHQLGSLRLIPSWSTTTTTVTAILPLHWYVRGHALDKVPRKAIGDTTVQARRVVFQGVSRPLRLGIEAGVHLPTGAERAWLGAAGFGGTGGVHAAWGDASVIAADVRYNWSPHSALTDFRLGPSVSAAVGAHHPLGPSLRIAAELLSEHFTSTVGAVEGRWEALGSLRWQRAPVTSFRLGGGSALSSGVGTPDFRCFAEVAWHPPTLRATP